VGCRAIALLDVMSNAAKGRRPRLAGANRTRHYIFRAARCLLHSHTASSEPASSGPPRAPPRPDPWNPFRDGTTVPPNCEARRAADHPDPAFAEGRRR